MSLYESPDIRKQTIEQAEAFIASKRVRRMILLQSFKEKESVKIAALKGSELERFQKRAERVSNALTSIVTAIDKAEKALENLIQTHNALTNAEQREIEL